MSKYSTRPQKDDFVSIKPPEPKQYAKFRLMFASALELFNEGFTKAECGVLKALIEEIKEYTDEQPK